MLTPRSLVALVLALAGVGGLRAQESLQATPVGVEGAAVDLGDRLGLGVLGAERLEGRFVPEHRVGPLGQPPAGIELHGRRLRLEGLTIDQLTFADPAQAMEYGSRVGREGDMVVDVRGPYVIVLQGPAAADPDQVTAALRAAWTGRPARERRSLLALQPADGSVAAISALRGPLHDQVAEGFVIARERLGDVAPHRLHSLGGDTTFEWLDDERRTMQIRDAKSVTRGTLGEGEVRFVTARDRARADALTDALSRVAEGTRARMEAPPTPAGEEEGLLQSASKGVRRVIGGLLGD